jgi:hypothetical protein
MNAQCCRKQSSSMLSTIPNCAWIAPIQRTHVSMRYSPANRAAVESDLKALDGVIPRAYQRY